MEVPIIILIPGGTLAVFGAICLGIVITEEGALDEVLPTSWRIRLMRKRSQKKLKLERASRDIRDEEEEIRKEEEAVRKVWKEQDKILKELSG